MNAHSNIHYCDRSIGVRPLQNGIRWKIQCETNWRAIEQMSLSPRCKNNRKLHFNIIHMHTTTVTTNKLKRVVTTTSTYTIRSICNVIYHHISWTLPFTTKHIGFYNLILCMECDVAYFSSFYFSIFKFVSFHREYIQMTCNVQTNIFLSFSFLHFGIFSSAPFCIDKNSIGDIKIFTIVYIFNMFICSRRTDIGFLF